MVMPCRAGIPKWLLRVGLLTLGRVDRLRLMRLVFSLSVLCVVVPIGMLTPRHLKPAKALPLSMFRPWPTR